MTEQAGLFEVPDAARALLPAERIYPADATWTAWKGAHRTCDVCGRLVLQMGMEEAPHPMPGRWRRKGPNGDMFVCSPHMQELKPKDDEVRERLAAMRSTVKVPAQRKPAGQRQYGS